MLNILYRVEIYFAKYISLPLKQFLNGGSVAPDDMSAVEIVSSLSDFD